VAKILLTEQLGYRVELVAIDETAQFAALATNGLSATLEIWPSGHSNHYRRYVQEEKTVEDLGPLGVEGKIGWFIPDYLRANDPSLATWQGVKAQAQLFQTAASGAQGQLLQGDPTWVYRDSQIISELGLNLKPISLGSETALLAAIDQAYSRREPLLFYFWTPHPLHARLALAEVQLPPYADNCLGCGYPVEILYKAASVNLRLEAPAAYRLLKNLSYGNQDQIAMLADVTYRGLSPEAAARSWLEQNRERWSVWLQQTPPSKPRIPAPANTWAASNLFVLDKDTNGVFLDANLRYVQSLQPLFPEIQSVTNLIGHDDFYFYPAALAEKFRADDQNVLAGGVPFTTVEANEPVGGVRTIVRVTKIPLRDEIGRVIGLRAVWYTQPQLEARRRPGGLEVSYPDESGLFVLYQAQTLRPPPVWLPYPGPANPVAGRITQPVVAAGAEGYFQLIADRPVKIGALLSLTGDWSTLGRNCQAALEIGVEALNLEHLSSGSAYRFALDIRDTQLQPETSRVALESLVTNGVSIVVGPQSSAEVRALKPAADASGVIVVSPSSTASSLAITNDNIFRFCPDDTYEAEAMVALLRVDDIQAIVPAWREDAGNQGLHDSMERLFAAQGGSVSAGVKYAAAETDFPSVVTRLNDQVVAALREHPGKVAVYLAAFDEVVEIFKLARTHAALASVKWYGSDGVVQSVPLATDPAAAQFAAERGYPCPTFGLDDRYRDTWAPIATAVKRRTGIEVDAFTLAAYDALRVGALAHVQAGPNPAFPTLKSAFVAQASGYTGATGQIQLNGAGDRAGGAFDFWTLKPGTNGYFWARTISYQPGTNGTGTIVRFP
jgi:ABC-type proline/glycine betaine transport system substrate-binding protein/ABC-type branched-subunit amino acid transport system substrate-binding protein